jgi:hypothetical protein
VVVAQISSAVAGLSKSSSLRQRHHAIAPRTSSARAVADCRTSDPFSKSSSARAGPAGIRHVCFVLGMLLDEAAGSAAGDRFSASPQASRPAERRRLYIGLGATAAATLLLRALTLYLRPLGMPKLRACRRKSRAL